MLFLEPWFWGFAAVVIPLLWLCPPSLKVYWLLAASAVFHYHFAGPAGVIPIIVLALLTYGAALTAASAWGRVTCASTGAVLVGALVLYKYSGLFARSASALLALARLDPPSWMAVWHTPAAPLAISFFTFEFIHYLYEVRIVARPPIRNPVHFALFAIFFPTLACGPIKRYPDFIPQLATLETPRAAEVWCAVQRVIRGLFKKVCIADVLVEWVKVIEAPPRLNGPLVVVLAVSQGLRIYYDFAGYSDIAIGLAQMLGLRVPENFDRPYFATSLREFWRRWHMSLSFWIRDYIYIPLGGNRAHRVLNVLAAMLLCGLWHGAAWHFAFWGLYHGTGLALEALLHRWWPSLFGERRGQRLLGWLACYSFVTYGWLIFFYPLGTVYEMTKAVCAWALAF